jgi:hypothetical protein
MIQASKFMFSMSLIIFYQRSFSTPTVPSAGNVAFKATSRFTNIRTSHNKNFHGSLHETFIEISLFILFMVESLLLSRIMWSQIIEDYCIMNWKGCGRKRSCLDQSTSLEFAWSDRRKLQKPHSSQPVSAPRPQPGAPE